MEGHFAGVGVIGGLFYVVLIILWALVPVFVFLISKRVKEMRDIARESRLEIKELNASLKYLKRKFNESDKQQS
ncbi:MAG: hypothetical protein HWE26_06860 [Alteromonadaceae bacterium]|nr:hypothetical protein [Alteromonadaceae bacterium]